MLYKIINEIVNVPNKEILIPADTRTRGKHGHKFCILNDNTYHKIQIFIFPKNQIPVELCAKRIS